MPCGWGTKCFLGYETTCARTIYLQYPIPSFCMTTLTGTMMLMMMIRRNPLIRVTNLLSRLSLRAHAMLPPPDPSDGLRYRFIAATAIPRGSKYAYGQHGPHLCSEATLVYLPTWVFAWFCHPSKSSHI